MRENYVNKIKEIAKELEQLRLDIWKDTNHDLDKKFFEHTDNMLFKAQSDLNYTIADAVGLLDYKDE